MKKLILLLALLGSISLSTFATHNLGGYIHYKHIAGLTYEITVVTYSDFSSVAADRCELVVKFGDGTSQTVSRSNGNPCTGGQSPCNHCGQIISGTSKRNEYVIQHTYPSANTYIISMLDPNRNAGIINIVNSVQVPFYIESELVILSSNFVNTSPMLISYPTISVNSGNEIHQNLMAVDTDGDILTYELVSAKGSNGNDYAGYHIPDSVSIDELSGEIFWKNITTNGNYVLTIKINQCRDNVDIGYTLVDIQVSVAPFQSTPQFTGLTNWPTDYFGRYSITIGPNDSVDLDLTYGDAFANATYQLDAFSEAFNTGNSSSFTTVGSTSISTTKKFNWSPNTGNLRCAPYVVTFRGMSNVNGQIQTDDVTLMVFVRDQTTSNCSSVCGSILTVKNDLQQDDISVSISPNPVLNQAVISIKTDRVPEFITFSLYNILGEKVRVISCTSFNDIVFVKEDLPSGIYIFTIENGQSTLKSGKLVITE